MRAREKNLRDSFSPASLDSFGSRARARAIFFPRVPRRNTFQEKEGREKEVKFLLDRRNPTMRECVRRALEDPPRARFHANAKNSNSPFHSTIFTAQNVGDIVEYRDASSSKTSSIKSALSHHHGDGKRHERQFPEVRGFYTAVAWSRMLDKGTCKRRFFSTEIFFFFFNFFSPQKRMCSFCRVLSKRRVPSFVFLPKRRHVGKSVDFGTLCVYYSTRRT